MSSHEGVSCDSCLKGNFSGKRYKCLICYDYDLCSTCFEANMTSTHHSLDHPMQCILTRTDFELFYGGETFSLDQQLSYTCPLCGRLGFTDVLLQEHVGLEHTDSSSEVVCPICACFPTGDPNHIVDDLAGHLLLEHRSSSELDAQVGGIRSMRRMPHQGRGMSSARTRRGNMHFQSGGAATLPILSPGGRDRELMDPIAELLSQLSTARSRVAAAQNISSQLHQLEIQLQSSRYGTMRQPQAERLLPSLGETAKTTVTIPATFGRSSTTSQIPTEALTLAIAGSVSGNAGASSATGSTSSGSSPRSGRSCFLLSKLKDVGLTDAEKQTKETERADKGLFVQELLLSLWAEEDKSEELETTDKTHDTQMPVEVLKVVPVTPVRLEVATPPVVNSLTSSIMVRPASVDGIRSTTVNNGITFADGKFHTNRSSTGKTKPVAVGRPGREQMASAKKH